MDDGQRLCRAEIGRGTGDQPLERHQKNEAESPLAATSHYLLHRKLSDHLPDDKLIVSVGGRGYDSSETLWAVLVGSWAPVRPFDLCTMLPPTGDTRTLEAKRSGNKREGGVRQREKNGRGGRKPAMNICCLSVPSPTGSGNPRIRCTAAAAAVATPALSNTNTMALLSQTKLER